MPTFEYTARDAESASRSGRIEAADPQSARVLLERAGLEVLRLAPSESTVKRLPALSAADSLELASQIAELSKAGLPLAAGLRAMQAELPRGRLAATVDALAGQLEAGAPADTALAAAVGRLPAYIRGMLSAGIGSGRLAEVLEECLEHAQMQAELRRRVWSVVAYPLLVLALTVVWLAFLLCVLMTPLLEVLADNEFAPTSQTKFFLWLAGPGGRVLLALCAAVLLAPLVLRLVLRTLPGSLLAAQIPLFGPLWRAGHLVGFCNLLATMLDQSIPLPTALRLTADGLGDAELQAACRKAADRTAAGESLAQCVTSQRAFPQTLGPIVLWGQRLSAPSEALRSAGQLYRHQVDLQAELLAAVVPPVTFLAVASILVGTVYAGFLPIVRMLALFTWGLGRVFRDLPNFDAIEPAGVGCLLAIGLALLVATRLVYFATPGRADSVHLLLKLTAAVVLTVAVVGLFLMIAGLGGLLLIAASVMVAEMALIQLGDTRRRGLLDLLTLVTAKQMPLAPAVTAFAGDQSVGYRRRIRSFADELERGVPLAEALRHSRRLVPAQTLVAAQVGERTGELSAALSQVAVSYAFRRPLRQALMARAIYVFWMAWFMPLVFAFVADGIYPSIVRIFHEFGAALPGATIVMHNVLTSWPAILVGIVLPIFGLVTLGLSNAYYTGLDPLPMFGLSRWLERGNVLRALALAVKSRLPLGEALARLAEAYPNRPTVRRLRASSDDVLRGADLAARLFYHGLIGRGDVAVIESAQRVGNLHWALRQLADSSERRVVYRMESALNILTPLAILVLGVVVLFFVVSIFAPLVVLIRSLA